ncbi:MAG: sigma-54 dependent transcriptional regulator [Gammaproteobacteria bacterium]
MDYVLVNDDCAHCRYISDAFTLLRLPLKKLNLSEFISDAITETVAVLLCRNTEEQHTDHLIKTLNTSNASVISLNEPTKKHNSLDRPIYYLKMPFSTYELKDAMLHCLNNKSNVPDLLEYNYAAFDKLIGRSPQICKIKTVIKQVACSDATVLILGQSGTGKDVIASCIHYLSNRKNNPLVPINCGAIPGELIESELFGHEKGAFTGALTRRPGRFEIANGGTLFLDEIGDMPLPMQVKLLRVLQERKIERVGGNVSITVDARLIAATNKNLEDLIQKNLFREDLFYRLNVFPIHVPSLGERPEDIPLLIDYHLDKISERLKHRVVFSKRAEDALCNYTWPGNIRELQNFLERMVILFPDHVIDEKDIDLTYKQNKIKTAQNAAHLPVDAPFNIKEYIAKVEQHFIEVALARSNGIVNAAAEYLSLGRTTLIEKMKKYKLLNQSTE